MRVEPRTLLAPWIKEPCVAAGCNNYIHLKKKVIRTKRYISTNPLHASLSKSGTLYKYENFIAVTSNLGSYNEASFF